MFDSASSFSALVGIAVDVVILFMALLSFVESAPRAYRLKVSNAALSISTSGGTIPDFATALRLFHPLAEQGDASAQSNLGVMYEQGRGIAQNYREAMRWFWLAAMQGDARAQSNLGVMYFNGQGIAHVADLQRLLNKCPRPSIRHLSATLRL
jgi:hypothetical protein